MTDFSRFLHKLALSAGVIFAVWSPVILFNLILDPYGIFDPHNTRVMPGLTERIVKMKQMLDNPNKYETFLFGNSRVNNIDLKAISENAYNVSLRAATVVEELQNLKRMLRHGVTVRRLFIGVDDLTYGSDPNDLGTQTPTFLYPEEPYKRIIFYLKYALIIPNPVDVLSYLRSNKKIIHYQYGSTGRELFISREIQIQSNPEAHISTLSAKLTSDTFRHPERIDNNLRALQEIKNLCDQKGIALTVFINPAYKFYFGSIDIDAYTSFLTRLVKITSYIDFSGLNSHTEDPLNFYEYHHYRPQLGDLIGKVLWESTTTTTEDADFGTNVTTQNVMSHVQALKTQWESLQR